jgi:acyl-coenzyme A synthetase/AMP-(fatty) acid ligase
MMGYLDDDAATRAAFVGRGGHSWLRAGAALERALAATPGVHEAAVVAAADPRGGVRVYGFVAAPAATVATVERAAPFAGKLVPLESLPHAADGTVDRQALRRMVAPD